MATPQPGIGDWYRLNGGALFEVVALDDDDGTIEIQYFDGTVEEMDIEDWESQWEEGALESAEAIATCAPAPSTVSTCSNECYGAASASVASSTPSASSTTPQRTSNGTGVSERPAQGPATQ